MKRSAVGLCQGKQGLCLIWAGAGALPVAALGIIGQVAGPNKGGDR